MDTFSCAGSKSLFGATQSQTFASQLIAETLNKLSMSPPAGGTAASSPQKSHAVSAAYADIGKGTRLNITA